MEYSELYKIARKVNLLADEIEYARSQLQPHDTGHIHTAISWMLNRHHVLKCEILGDNDEDRSW